MTFDWRKNFKKQFGYLPGEEPAQAVIPAGSPASSDRQAGPTPERLAVTAPADREEAKAPKQDVPKQAPAPSVAVERVADTFPRGGEAGGGVDETGPSAPLPIPAEDRLAIVRRMAAAGESYELIARAIGTTRNAVSGIVARHREEWALPKRENAHRRPAGEPAVRKPRVVPGHSVRRPPAPALVRPPRPEPVVPSPTVVTPEPLPTVGLVQFVARRSSECAFPMWNHYGPIPMSDQLMVCGAPVVGETEVYCGAHRALCRVKSPVRIERVAGMARHL